MSITDNCTTSLLSLECFNVEQLKNNKVISAIACFIIVFMVQYDFKRCCMIFGAKLDINFFYNHNQFNPANIVGAINIYLPMTLKSDKILQTQD